MRSFVSRSVLVGAVLAGAAALGVAPTALATTPAHTDAAGCLVGIDLNVLGGAGTCDDSNSYLNSYSNRDLRNDTDISGGYLPRGPYQGEFGGFGGPFA